MFPSHTERVVVMVVEDEALIRMAMVDLLEEEGYSTVEAANADKAIEILARRDDIRIILTDIDMPGSMDGMALVRAVRDRWPPIRIIVTSGRHCLSEEDLPSGSRFFGKPWQDQALMAAVREMAAWAPL